MVETVAKRDYYEVLGLDRDASAGDVKKAFQRLAMKHHPDRDGGDEEKFKEISGAYQVLGDAEKRGAYDRFGHAGVDPNAGGGFNGASFSDVFGDVFGDIFAGATAGRGRRSVQRGADLRYGLELDLEQAVGGDSVEIRIPSLAACDPCDGSGAAPGTRPETCPECRGNGEVRVRSRAFGLDLYVKKTCPRCLGTGEVITEPCRQCRGTGRVKRRKTLSVRVPAGVHDGARFRLSGEGEAGFNGGPPGDCIVQIAVRDHPIFERDGMDLFCDVPISFVEAALGGELEVPTLDGRVRLSIPPETQTNKVFRLRNKGAPSARRRGVGDLLCRVVVETPVELTEGQKTQLRAFGEALAGNDHKHSPKGASWFKSVKEFFEGLAG